MMRIVLATIALVSVLGAIVVHWMPGPPRGLELWSKLACSPSAVRELHLWTLVTSGVLTSPTEMGHVLMTLLGFYFLTPQLEKTWGGARLLRMLLIAVVVGNLTVLVVDGLLPGRSALFHPGAMFGPEAALAAVAAAWSREYANAQVRLFFVLPVSGRTLLWVTLGFCVLGLVYAQGPSEGAVAPFGGVAVGLLLGGHPSPARALWLRVKLALLRRRGAALTVESILEDTPRSLGRTGPPSNRSGVPPLRVVKGGLEDDLKNRKPPKDKRYLN
jgi:membrane associated rhomboid family serine protease